MGTKFAFKTSVCMEYEGLLLISKTALDNFKKEREELNEYGCGQNKNEAMKTLIRLRADYQRAYSRLIHHFDVCGLCQHVSKISERTQPISSSVIAFKRSSA
jgi:hypothetical protein